MRIIWVFIGIVLFLVLGYTLDFIKTVTDVLWQWLGSIGVEKIDLGIDFTNNIYIPLITAGASMLVISAIMIIATSIRERRG